MRRGQGWCICREPEEQGGIFEAPGLTRGEAPAEDTKFIKWSYRFLLCINVSLNGCILEKKNHSFLMNTSTHFREIKISEMQI